MAAIVMLGALAAMFVPEHPDPLVVVYFAAPSLALAMLSNLLDGRKALTGDRRRRPPVPEAEDRARAEGRTLIG